MTRTRRHQPGAAAYPALIQFARAYLHEDFVHEYGGAVEAAQAFHADATLAECRTLATELDYLAEESSRWPSAKLAVFVTGTIGAAWGTASTATLREMAAVLRAAR